MISILLSSSFHVKETLNETKEGPTYSREGEQGSNRTETQFRGSRWKEVVDGDSDRSSSVQINLTDVSSSNLVPPAADNFLTVCGSFTHNEREKDV